MIPTSPLRIRSVVRGPGWLPLALVALMVQAFAPARQLHSPQQVGALPPAWLHGVWAREWIEVRSVRSDHFAVHYLQTPSIFGDMRLPVERPSFAGAASFADLTDSDLLELARQRGFTGYVTATGDTITWHHEVDFQPSDGTPDIGRAERFGPTQWYEHALDSAYAEMWRSVAVRNGAFLVLRVERTGRLERTLIVVGDHLLYVRNRARDLPVAPSLDSLIRASRATREQIIAYLDCEFSTGRVRGGRIPWEIQASTLPWLEGRALEFARAVTVLPDSARLDVQVGSPERWLVPINTLSPADLVALFPGAG